METIFVVVVIGVVLVLILFKSNIGKNPSKKTDAMLLREYNLHNKRVLSAMNLGPKQYEKALKEMSVLTDEMRARGLLSDTDFND